MISYMDLRVVVKEQTQSWQGDWGTENQVPQGEKSRKLESEAHLLSPIHASPPTHYADTGSPTQRGSRAPSPR